MARAPELSVVAKLERSINAEQTVAVLEGLAAKRGVPANNRADNIPLLVAAVLREWCWHGATAIAYIEPGSPWQNPTLGPSKPVFASN